LEGVWHSKEITTATFGLRGDKARFVPPGKLFNETLQIRIPDFKMTFVRFESSDQAEKAVPQSLRMRPGLHSPKEEYRGAVLYRYLDLSGGTSRALCSFGLYVVEIGGTPGIETELVMKILDVVLAEVLTQDVT